MLIGQYPWTRYQLKCTQKNKSKCTLVFTMNLKLIARCRGIGDVNVKPTEVLIDEIFENSLPQWTPQLTDIDEAAFGYISEAGFVSKIKTQSRLLRQRALIRNLEADPSAQVSAQKWKEETLTNF